MSLIIVHHLGLGDQLMLCGMVRYLLQKQKVEIIACVNHKDTLEFMYKDCLDRLKINYVNTPDPREVWGACQGKKVLPLATYSMSDDKWKSFTMSDTPVTNWALSVYVQAKVNPHYMRSKFKVIRDHEAEDRVYNKYYKGEPYIFVHDSGSVKTPPLNIKSDLQIIRPSFDETNVFDYLKLIENAEEVHCINSSFVWLVELTKVRDNKKGNFYHYNVTHTYYNYHYNVTVFSDDLWEFV